MKNYLSYELCKKLAELNIWQDIETESIYADDTWFDMNIYKNEPKFWVKDNNLIWWPIKAFNLEEALEILPNNINKNNEDYELVFWRHELWYWWNYFLEDEDELYILNQSIFRWNYRKKTLIEAIEKILEYLIDNKLIWNTTN